MHRPSLCRLLLVASAFLCVANYSAANSSAAELNGLSDAEKKTGWQLLFDGKSTDGWRNYQKDSVGASWTIEDGVLHRRGGAGAGDLITKEQYQYFELSIEYQISKGGNSGLIFHVTEDEKKPWQTGPEIQIQDNLAGHDAQKAGWLYQLYQPVKPAWAIRFEKQAGFETPAIDDATRPAGEWNHIYLRISKQQCEVAINGVSYYYFRLGDAEWNKRVAASKFARYEKFGKTGKGHICLQDHGNPVAFRNIKLRELPEDGTVPDPSSGVLPLVGKSAFPDLKWEGWQGVDDDGKTNKLRPMILTHAGDGSGRVFVATQRGPIHVFDGRDAKQTKLFLDLTAKVNPWAKDNEEGLLGFAFHPKHKENGHFYVYYSSQNEPRTSIVSRFTVSKDDPNRADPDSEQVVMKIPQPFSNHNGGSITFGHDGYLYIGLGDGGGRNDPMGHGQNVGSWMGSLLRIDVDRKSETQNYGIPADNPFVSREGALPEIYAYGFRNIWRLSTDRKTGRIWAADVGQDLWEEINIVQAGGNYGWSSRESLHAFGNKDLAGKDPLVQPVWEYDHRVGKSITGGIVYRGDRLKELQGKYVYADFVSGKIWALELDEASGAVKQNLLVVPGGLPVLAFGEDEAGEIYYMLETINGRGIFRFEKTN
jgi:glucose/arabinose dehydrogenase